jgi:hypothetical protein
MFYRKVPSNDFDSGTLVLEGDAGIQIKGLAKAFFVPDLKGPNEIEVIFECGPDEAETIERHGEATWRFEGTTGGEAGALKHRVSVPVRFDKENASHTSPKMQLRLVWAGGDYRTELAT